MFDNDEIKIAKIQKIIQQEGSEFKELQKRLSEDLYYLNELSVDLLELFKSLNDKQEELKKERDRYSDLYDFAPVGYLSITHEGIITEANKKSIEIFDCENNGLINKSLFSFFNVECFNCAKRYIDDVESDKSLTLEAQLKIKQKQKLWVLIEICRKRDNNPNMQSFRVSITDISELKDYQKEIKNSKKEIRASGDFLNLVIESIPNPIFFKDKKGAYTLCNQAFVDFVGKRKEQIIGKNVVDVLGDDPYVEIYQEEDRKLLSSGKNQVYEAKIKHADGTYHDVIFNKAAFKAKSKEISGIVGFIIDISQRKKFEKEIRLSEKKFRSMFDSMLDSVILLSTSVKQGQGILSYRILDINPAFEKMTGLDAKKVKGRNLKTIAPNLNPMLLNMIDEIISSDEPVRMEFYSEDAGKYLKAVVFVPQRGQLVIILSDITQQKETEKKLKERQALLDSIIENIPFEFFALDKKLKYTLINPVFAEKWGINTGMDFSDSKIEKGVHEIWDGFYNRALKGEIVSETSQIFLNNSSAHVHNIIAPLKKSGRINGILGFSTDITEQRNAEIELKASQERFRYIVDNTFDWEFFKDANEKLIYSSPAFTRITGYGLADYLSGELDFRDIVYKDDRAKFDSLMDLVGLAKIVNDEEFRLVRVDGVVKYVSISVQPVFDQVGGFAGYRASVRDIDIRKQKELKMEMEIEELKKKIEKLEAPAK